MGLLDEFFPRPHGVSAVDIREAERLGRKKKGAVVSWSVYQAAKTHGIKLRNVRVVDAPLPPARNQEKPLRWR